MEVDEQALERFNGEVRKLCEKLFREGFQAARENQSCTEEDAWSSVDLQITTRVGAATTSLSVTRGARE